MRLHIFGDEPPHRVLVLLLQNVPFLRVWLSLTLLPVLAASSLASDYSHECRTADGLYEIQDGALYQSGQTTQQIPFENLGETIIKRETGYCLSNKAGNQRFGYESKDYSMRLRFIANGQTIETVALCQLASDGLPAAYSCDKQVVTSRTGTTDGTPPDNTGGGSTNTWMHNGSAMTLTAVGNRRTFRYLRPRSGVAKAGAKRGSVLFEGVKDGNTYRGTAYIFSRRCGPQSYAVSGDVAANQRRVTLYGEAPKLNAACQIKGRKSDTLVFTHAPDR